MARARFTGAPRLRKDERLSPCDEAMTPLAQAMTAFGDNDTFVIRGPARKKAGRQKSLWRGMAHRRRMRSHSLPSVLPDCKNDSQA